MPGHPLGVEHDVHDRRLSRRERTLERGHEVTRPLDVLRVAAEDLAEPVVAARREPRRDLALVPEDPDLRDADLAPGGIVADDEHRRDREADERVEVEAVQAERAVPEDADEL